MLSVLCIQMQCGELIYRKNSLVTQVTDRHARQEKETIHSGHFMVSHFEAEAQDDEDDLALPVPEEEQLPAKMTVVGMAPVGITVQSYLGENKITKLQQQQLSIETSLTKLFRCMSLAYRQKLTSPKWNRFKGIKLRWKDKIRLNNVIWRCWHMQFIKKQNTLVCQFASPLDVDTHVKPETTILEGKYWKRRAEAVTAEYKKWRMFHMHRAFGKGDSVVPYISDMETAECLSQNEDLSCAMLMDEDYIEFMSDTLFSTISSNQPFAFPDFREIARGASLADFIQPSLGPLQPNLDDFMDTLEPLQELLSASRLPPVPEEPAVQNEMNLYRDSNTNNTFQPPAYQTHNAQSIVQNQTMPSNQFIEQRPDTSMIPQRQQQNISIIKNEAVRNYDNSLFASSPPVAQNAFAARHADTFAQEQGYVSAPSSNEQVRAQALTGKHMRASYGAEAKVYNQPPYGKGYSVITTQGMQSQQPQTAIDALSMLQMQQQPASIPSLNRNNLMPTSPGYSRDRARSRISTYSAQLPSAPPYQPFGLPATTLSAATLTSRGYETTSPLSRQQQAQHLTYLSPVDMVSNKNRVNRVDTRMFKVPSPPLTNIAPHQTVPSPNQLQPMVAVSSKENFRSNSLPIGSQLNADWSISLASNTQPINQPQAIGSRVSGHQPPLRGGARVRSRSSSGPPRRVHPPPLASVASDPSLPQASVLLAHLLASQQSAQQQQQQQAAAVYKLGMEGPIESSKLQLAASAPTTPVHSPVALCVSPTHGSNTDLNTAQQAMQRLTSSSPLALARSSSPTLEPLSPLSPRSPPSPRRDPRRAGHIHAEQVRRYNIKNGFDTLQALIPQLSNNPNAKVSKAAMLQKGAEYIKQLKAERNQIKEEMDNLRQQIDSLNNSISNCHSLLPATGAPVSRARAGRLREMFAAHVASRTRDNWKYWLFSILAEPLVASFSSCVSAASARDLRRTTLLWAEQHCSLVEMRPAVLNSLRGLCTTTEILTNPENLPEEALAAVDKSTSIKREPL